MESNDAEDPYPMLPERFRSKVNSYPECSYGAVRVTLVLKSGRRIRDVIIGGDAICKIGDRHIRSHSDLDFSVDDIKNVKMRMTTISKSWSLGSHFLPFPPRSISSMIS
jgi:hypothetical protein